MIKKSAARRTSRRSSNGVSGADAKSYTYPDATSALRPDVGVQAQFRKKKPPKTYRYDTSLSPLLEWDEQPAREQGEALIDRIANAESLEEAKAAAEELKAMSKPFLNWAGKAERHAFDVPTLPLFVHERLSTKAILDTVRRHRRDKQEELDLFGDPRHDLADQVLRAYEHRDAWVNRMILGDSLIVMNSLLEYEGMGGQVQMIYIDPPYGVRFNGNFQPFVRKRVVRHNDDAEMTREPEMVKAYRDTWELGIHSYLTYLRDRLLLSRNLLTPSGSVFVQISDDNLHHVRELLDEIFGPNNFVGQITVQKTAGQDEELLNSTADYLLWYARDKPALKYRKLFVDKSTPSDGGPYNRVELPDGSRRSMSLPEREGRVPLPEGAKRFRIDNTSSSGHGGNTTFPFEFNGRVYFPSRGRHWSTSLAGLQRLAARNRLLASDRTVSYVRYLDDFPCSILANIWTDTGVGGFTDPKIYVVQTVAKIIQRCVLMTTDPGDLILDPTCGSGTSAYVAEQWGRRWITIDTSRVPLALARQRLLTATFPWYELKDPARGPAGGFIYKRKQNARGEEVGGIVPHVTLKSIANDESPAEEVLVDRPEQERNITRVTGPFVLEATMPTPVDYEGDGEEDSGVAEDFADFVDRMVEVLRRSPDLRLPGNVSVRLEQVRRPAKTLSLSAEAMVAGKPVAVVFGPENGAVSQTLVFNACREAFAKGFSHLFVFGFEIEPAARSLVDQAESALGIPSTYVAATPDLVLGDLLKTMRSSQVFSITGLPDVKVEKLKVAKGEVPQFQVSLLGLDTFDPATMDLLHVDGGDVPVWFLDTDYDPTRCFRVCQAFFPKTGAWDNLKRELRAEYDESLWDHLAGTTSAPFEAGEQRQLAVKVIDERGNELLVVKSLPE